MLKNNNNNNNCLFVCLFVCWARDYHIASNFWKFDLIRTGFTSGELVSLVKVFGLFRLEWILVVPNVFSSSYVCLQPSSQCVLNVFSSSYVCVQPSSQCVPQHVPNGTLLYNLVSFALKFYSL
jgi:hypothetical protein